jgi:hypothetical protein
MKTLLFSLFLLIAVRSEATQKAYIILSEGDCNSCLTKAKSLQQALGINLFLLLESEKQKESAHISKIVKSLNIEHILIDSVMYAKNNIGSSLIFIADKSENILYKKLIGFITPRDIEILKLLFKEKLDFSIEESKLNFPFSGDKIKRYGNVLFALPLDGNYLLKVKGKSIDSISLFDYEQTFDSIASVLMREERQLFLKNGLSSEIYVDNNIGRRYSLINFSITNGLLNLIYEINLGSVGIKGKDTTVYLYKKHYLLRKNAHKKLENFELREQLGNSFIFHYFNGFQLMDDFVYLSGQGFTGSDKNNIGLIKSNLMDSNGTSKNNSFYPKPELIEKQFEGQLDGLGFSEDLFFYFYSPSFLNVRTGDYFKFKVVDSLLYNKKLSSGNFNFNELFNSFTVKDVVHSNNQIFQVIFTYKGKVYLGFFADGKMLNFKYLCKLDGFDYVFFENPTKVNLYKENSSKHSGLVIH